MRKHERQATRLGALDLLVGALLLSPLSARAADGVMILSLTVKGVISDSGIYYMRRYCGIHLRGQQNLDDQSAFEQSREPERRHGSGIRGIEHHEHDY
jgi:hypothetical protein